MPILKEEALRKFGLTEREVKVYLAALVTGTATANTIAKYAKVERTTTYDILKSLMEKGIASYILKDKRKCFEVIPPQNLISILDANKRSLQEVLPELRALAHTTIEKPKVSLFEGKLGIKNIIHDVYKEGKNFDVYANSEIITFLNHDFEKFVKLRTQQKIFVRVIHEKSAETIKLIEEEKYKQRDVRYLENFKLPSATFIYANKVAIFNFSKLEPIGVLIENRDIANTQRIVFEKLWSLSKKK
ncbi:MAG: helix-turn-helix domain-containing protein [Candidatus Woesearchaeota archaeon]|nr:helix-turn-helix domain-containing protein [Candidatus Woesearchaeota archaeon]